MKYDAGQVYPPSEDTWLLLGAAEREVRFSDAVCEIGCGSGAVSAGIMHKCARLAAVDINPHAVVCAREKGVDARLGDMFSPFAASDVFDLILFNAPYLPTAPEERVDDWLEYALDGGADGREPLRRFLPQAVLHLAPKGRILLLISSLTSVEEVVSLANAYGLEAVVFAEEVQEDGERLVVL
ncbi:MAG TPA: methyltransferase, partial [Methanocorpusculum sp.]|nr:methyltransferase [Methanocorpusculum sp.]